MSDRPISFRVCDFSEQVVPRDNQGSYYSAVMHIDGRIYQYKYAISPKFSLPLAALRSAGWLNLLEQVMGDMK